MSEDSNSDLEIESNLDAKKFKLLLQRCQRIQHENEQIVYRIQCVRKLSKKARSQVKFLKKRLDHHGDNYTAASIEAAQVKTKSRTALKPKGSRAETDKSKKNNHSKKPAKRKSRGDKERDPNAPKRPANPFFQFCQEQRQVLMEQLNADLKPGETELTKQELTRQLAVKWKSLSGQDKKVYIDMYERSKEKYVEEMSAYNCKT